MDFLRNSDRDISGLTVEMLSHLKNKKASDWSTVKWKLLIGQKIKMEASDWSFVTSISPLLRRSESFSMA